MIESANKLCLFKGNKEGYTALMTDSFSALWNGTGGDNYEKNRVSLLYYFVHIFNGV